MDYGTPGDEVVMGKPLTMDVHSPVEDIKELISYPDLQEYEKQHEHYKDSLGYHNRSLTEVVTPSVERAIMRILGWYNGSSDTWEIRKKKVQQILTVAQLGHEAPVEPVVEEGVRLRLKARDGKLLVDLGKGWEEMQPDHFFKLIQVSVAIS
jgi:hypothetical protein